MANDNNRTNLNQNPLLSTALGIIEAIAPGALDDPEKAFRELVPRMRFIVIARVEKPTVAQLETLRSFSEFGSSNLVQVRKALNAGDILLGPFPWDLAEQALMPRLAQAGLSVLLRELTEDEKAQQLDFFNNPPAYFRNV